MNGKRPARDRRRNAAPHRLAFLLAALALHLTLLYSVRITVPEPVSPPEQYSAVMSLVDIRETPPAPVQRALSAPAEPPITPDAVFQDDTAPAAPAQAAYTNGTAREETVHNSASSLPAGERIDFLPARQVSVLPRFDEAEIRRNMVYPAVARRAGLEGTVYLEIFVDTDGLVRGVTILKEEPAGRGFGDAAARAFHGMRGVPAAVRGVPAAVRYRYPVRFRLQ